MRNKYHPISITRVFLLMRNTDVKVTKCHLVLNNNDKMSLSCFEIYIFTVFKLFRNIYYSTVSTNQLVVLCHPKKNFVFVLPFPLLEHI
jgi:hypothetical protein